ncbi:MAG: hypothetical protein AAB966_00870 [Patescibacteria group bacterium]
MKTNIATEYLVAIFVFCVGMFSNYVLYWRLKKDAAAGISVRSNRIPA